jgi:hypothetical protein
MHRSRIAGDLNSAIIAVIERSRHPAGARIPTIARYGQGTARLLSRLPAEFASRDARSSSRSRPAAADSPPETR